MNILTSVDSFKGTMSSKAISLIIKKELEKKGHSVETIPISDGGEGFIDSLKAHFLVDGITIDSIDALGNPISCEILLINGTAYIEMNSSAGITIIKKENLNPLLTSTFGVGLIIKKAVDLGAKRIIMGIGGSSTNDGGAGMLQALGVKFYKNNHIITEHMNGKLIGEATSFDNQSLITNMKNISFEIYSDVINPLLGRQGCAQIYSPQKGANKAKVLLLEKAMTNFANLVEKYFNKKYRDIEGAGAAGGLGFGALTFLNASISNGIQSMIKLLNIEYFIKKSDLIIVGEGKLDNQTKNGKAPSGIAKLAKKNNKTVIGVFAVIDKSVKCDFLDQVLSIVPKFASKEDSITNVEYYFTKMIRTLEI